MSKIFTVEPRTARQSFMNFEIVTDLESLEADVAILGIPYSDPSAVLHAEQVAGLSGGILILAD